MARIRPLILTVAVLLAAAAPASAATDGTSNTLMSAVKGAPGPSFMDYTDDDCLNSVRPAPRR